MKRIINILAICSLIAAAGCGHYVASQPSSPVVIVPASPGPGYAWVQGSWRWNRVSHAYVWRDGYWVKRRGASMWVDGHWASTNRGWKYVPGHWR